MNTKRKAATFKNAWVVAIFVFSILLSIPAFSQGVAVNAAGTPADSSAILDVSSHTQGLLIPRMTTTERNAINSPALALMIYNTTTNCFETYVNGTWNTIWCFGGCPPPAAPTAGTNVPSQTTIVWNWNTVSGATGYQWNTTNTYPGVGINVVSSPTYTQSGLACNTAYTLYVWAYNACGYSSSVTLTQTTSACTWTCGSTLTITHTTGSVCPESKTVNYGTVTSSLSGASHCWITQNLGADHYATSATSDMTNASAGWYWQFNRIQGYLPNPTVVIPSGFLGSISETSDWIAANDPCTNQLGSGWRIPTLTEWQNVQTNAGWANVNDAYASVLKIHLGGNINSGSLTQRGLNGLMWCSTSATATASYTLFETATNSYMTGGTMGKTYGYSLRCIK